MLTFLALTVIPLVVLALIMLFAIWLANRLAYRMVGHKHHLLETIIKTGEVPDEWRMSQPRRRLFLQSQESTAWLARSKDTYLARLDEFIRYAETSPLVEDDDTRDVLLDRLDEIRADWAERDASAL
jgi:hypothetical protein